MKKILLAIPAALLALGFAAGHGARADDYLPEPSDAIKPEIRLRVLVVIPSPSDYPPLDVERELPDLGKLILGRLPIGAHTQVDGGAAHDGALLGELRALVVGARE